MDSHEQQIPARPRRCPDIREFGVRDELILVAPKRPAGSTGDELDAGSGADNRALVLNPSGRAIWELCDGERLVDEMVSELADRYAVEETVLARDVRETLGRMMRSGFVERPRPARSGANGTVFVIGVEDKPYFWWQTAIFLESFRGKLPAGWGTLVVVCNDGKPLSPDFARILSCYDTEVAKGTNYASTYPLDIGRNEGECYSALNRVEALSKAAALVCDEDVVCLLDSDIFLYGDLNVGLMPTGCAAPRNWHVEADVFFSSFDGNEGRGIDLQKLLEALGCSGSFKPGAVNVFVSGAVARNAKYIADCFRFAHAVFLLGRVAGADHVWMAEMPCFTLAMAANGIDYDLLTCEELLVSSCDEETIPTGTLYHYYSDPSVFGRTAFRGSKWYKQAYRTRNFLDTDFEHFATNAATDHERYFFELAERARERLIS